jgi:hypothetical protein
LDHEPGSFGNWISVTPQPCGNRWFGFLTWFMGSSTDTHDCGTQTPEISRGQICCWKTRDGFWMRQWLNTNGVCQWFCFKSLRSRIRLSEPVIENWICYIHAWPHWNELWLIISEFKRQKIWIYYFCINTEAVMHLKMIFQRCVFNGVVY